MNALIDWVKKTIISLAKFLIAILNLIINALGPDQSPEGHLIKSAVISINDEGAISLKSVNGISWKDHPHRTPHDNPDCQDDSAAGAEKMQILSGEVVKIGSYCFLITPTAGGHTCTPLGPC